VSSDKSSLDTDPMAKAIVEDDLLVAGEGGAPTPGLDSLSPEVLASVRVPLIRSDGSDYVVERGSPDAVSRLENELASIRLANDVLEERMVKLDKIRQQAADGEYQIDVSRAMMVNLESERDQAWEVADELRRRCASLEERFRDRPETEVDGDDDGELLPPSAEPSGIDEGMMARIDAVEESSRKLRATMSRSTSQIQHYLLELETARGGIARNLEEQAKYAEASTRLHTGVATLERYIADEDTAEVDPRINGMLEEIRAAANQVRMLEARSDRFGKSIENMLQRLTSVLMG
jgi:chromosome segregation ATPase